MVLKPSEVGTIIMFGLALISCSAGDSDNASSPTSPPPVAGTTVQVSVTATDPDGDQLHYRWAATDGTINNLDAARTTWVIPKGSGLQFAYVVVSDNKGGYIESRAAALTNDPTTTTPPAPHPFKAASPIGPPGFVWGSVYSDGTPLQPFQRRVYLPGITVRLSNGSSAVTDMKGQFFISNVQDNQPTNPYTATYSFPGVPGRPPIAFKQLGDPTADLPITVDATHVDLPTSPSSPAYVTGRVDLSGTLSVAGSVRMKDFSYCGIRNEFFTDPRDKNDPQRDRNLFSGPVSGSVKLLDTNSNPLSETFPINHYGDFLIVRSPLAPNTIGAKVRVTCEGAVVDSSVVIPPSGAGTIKLSKVVTLQNHRPIIASMSVLLNGEEKGRPDLPKSRTLFTSVNGTSPQFGDEDLIAEIIHTPGDDTFFTYKGVDTRKSACAYYKAIGAVDDCDARGYPTGNQLTLAQWRSKFHLSPFSTANSENPIAPGEQEVRLQYINRSDLNLGRDMQAVKLADGSIAYNTCNYPGPLNVNDPDGAPKEIGLETQADIDRSIQNIHDGLSMIACVAMDYQVKDGFTRFYTFGPTGQLLLSISLDGRREKFMPGTCTTCHGGDAYGGQFPEDGSGRPDLKSRWQPFDMANLKVRFNSSQDLAAANAAVKILNKRMVEPGLELITTDRTKSLIAGWYKDDGIVQNSTFIPPLSYIPSSLLSPPGTPTQTEKDLYQKVIQPGCQTCHAAQKVDEKIDDTKKVCGGDPDLEQNHKMTNSLVPFERLWLKPEPPSSSQPLASKLNLGCSDKPLRHPAL